MTLFRLAAVAVLAFGALLAPGGAAGQLPGKVYRLGIIYHGEGYAVLLDGLRQGLHEAGLDEGKQIVLDVRVTRGDLKAVEAAARELERDKVDLIYTVATSVSLAAMHATTHTPLVFFAGSDPVAAGLVDSLARPGGRATGVHGWATDLTAKRLELLKEIIPGLRRVVTFDNPGNTVARESALRGREAAQKLGVQLVERRVGTVDELRRSLRELKPREMDAFFQVSDAMVTSQAAMVIDVARTLKLPTMFYEESLVARGALASYGQNYRESGRITAKHVQKILAGVPPKDVPVENYDKIALVLNLRVAREIGLAIPAAVRYRADTVVE
jgi:putative tryptophan/tyrosine transport system substrate-binding protein